MKPVFSSLVWGTFWLLAAAFVIVNQLEGFTNIGIGSIIVTILSVAFIVQCLAHLRVAPLPIPLAVLYIIFQAPAGWPYIQPWTLVLAAALAALGLATLLPRRSWQRRCETGKDNPNDRAAHVHTVRTEESRDNDNNPAVSVNFGAVSRRLLADSLETVRLHCNFGALEIYFDHAELSSNGATVNLDCSFGAIKLLIPKHWRVIDNLNCTLGGVDADKKFPGLAENAPRLTLTGNVSLGGVEVRYI